MAPAVLRWQDPGAVDDPRWIRGSDLSPELDLLGRKIQSMDLAGPVVLRPEEEERSAVAAPAAHGQVLRQPADLASIAAGDGNDRDRPRCEAQRHLLAVGRDRKKRRCRLRCDRTRFSTDAADDPQPGETTRLTTEERNPIASGRNPPNGGPLEG